MADLTSTNYLISNTDPMCSICNIPIHPQFASPHLIEQIVYDRLDPAADPAWEPSGAATVEDYGRWCGHLCGLTCLWMGLGRASQAAPRPLALRAA
ncbi:hypothetical protein [Streptomyces sp. H27-C3]|uniref:hypothetical protein n=1 Tax=Streptomyces sp. H27-C3 TaxID=3046305 RepID=UPI0024BBCF76|nr:hypothetical protein [Streptomyces sp. H27-C3]MDJ0461714.1 hypothetical protein [Streptomyces sp. H27-C3]